MVLHGDHASRLEFDFGDADAVFDEEDFFGASVEDVEAALFVPFSGRGAEFVVLQEFDVDDAEGLVAEIAGDVGEVAGEESGLPVLQFDGDGVFALHGVGDFGVAERHVDVVVAVPMHLSLGVRREFCDEDADLGVGEGLVVVGLGGDFDFWLGLGV